jgi:transposase
MQGKTNISRRDVVELFEQLFSSRISTGTVDAILARAADALTVPCEDLLDRVRSRSARAVNMDETGWRLRGSQRAIWGMFTPRHAVPQITSSRHDDHAKNLLGSSSAIVTSDRWWAYNHLPVRRRQICWSHLQRDFEFLAEGRGSDKILGKPAWPSAQSCSGRGRSTSTPPIAKSSNAASVRSSAGSKPSLTNTPKSTPATAKAGASHARC